MDELEQIFDYIVSKKYPNSVKTNGQKVDFRRRAGKFTVEEGVLKRAVKDDVKNAKYLRMITDRTEQIRIIRATHGGLGETVESRSLGGHLGWDKTEGRLSKSAWWPGVRKDVPPKPWSQIGVDTCSLAKSKDGFTCMVVGNL
ncbi:uncharacterized protein LOC118478658 [Aplysia californica]|uniref:Uncharacterized protein LOC118478658 n=1 Tax=Aplysia californica TaxID=6500 RepID=A0ABM1W1N5_APLCA|nr:uncharacterized protein LOC118478658 [Aplysia californica]